MQLTVLFSSAWIRAARRVCVVSAAVVCLSSLSTSWGQELIIKREPITLINPTRYQVPLVLEATQSMNVSAPVDGVVQIINIKPGETVLNQTELLRLDTTRQSFVLEKAKAALRAAQMRVEAVSSSSDAKAKSLAASELDVAKADLNVAEYDLRSLLLRAPIDGTVFRVLVQPGQFVKAGEPLMSMGNTQKLVVQMPVDRNNVKVGANLEIAVESVKVTGLVQSVLPLSKEQATLRDLVESAATAELIIDNAQGKLSPGQTVYSPMVPRYPVMEATNAVLTNTQEGGRKVQVLRENVVTDVPVTVLGPIGPERSFLTGPLSERDLLIISTSVPVPHGTLVQNAVQPVPQPAFDN